MMVAATEGIVGVNYTTTAGASLPWRPGYHLDRLDLDRVPRTMDDDHREDRLRRWFLWLSLLFTIVGCLIAGFAVALPAWQVLDLPELSAVHEHAILYDCIRSEITPLDRLHTRDTTAPGPHRRCTAKIDPGLAEQFRLAIAEHSDLGARELLNHRFLPQHKAVLFFFVFTVLFAVIAVLVGACSGCFVPNAVLHVISIGMATSCSLLADIIFFIGATREDNQRIPGPLGVHQQHLSYAFFVHALGSLVLVLSTLCSGVACHLLLLRRWRHSIGRKRLALAWMEWRTRKAPEAEGQSGRIRDQHLPHDHHDPVSWKNTILSTPKIRSNSAASMDCLPPPPPTPQLFQNWPYPVQIRRYASVDGAEQSTSAVL